MKHVQSDVMWHINQCSWYLMKYFQNCNMCRLLGVCIRRVCLVCISMTFEPTRVDVYGRARTFGTVGHACAMKCEKCEKERVGECEHIFELHRTRRAIWWFLKTTTCFICFAGHCCLLSYSSFSTRTSRHWGCIYTLYSPPFSCQALSSSSLPSQLLPFWRHDNETASTATALHENDGTQLFVNRMF